MTANQVVKILVDSYLNSEHYMLALSSIHEINQIVSPQLLSSLSYILYLEIVPCMSSGDDFNQDRFRLTLLKTSRDFAGAAEL
jgi:hypothetical protein